MALNGSIQNLSWNYLKNMAQRGKLGMRVRRESNLNEL